MPLPTLRRSRSLEESQADRPSVVATRRRIDRRFPSLGFTIASSAPYVELLLATDPALLDPSNAAQRTASTFYASRADGGLTPTTANRARYVVPGRVVEKLATQSDAIWFLAVAYTDATGTGGSPSSPQGASGAVIVDRSFIQQRMPLRALGVVRPLARPAVMDDRLDGEDAYDMEPLSSRGGAVVIGQALRPRADTPQIVDRIDGEDGADVPRPAPGPPTGTGPAPTPEATVPVTAPAPAISLPAVLSPPTTPATNDGAAPAVPGTAEPPEPAEADLGRAEVVDALFYEDGWEDYDSGADQQGVTALDDEYPDIDWGDDDRYGSTPAYRSLDEPVAVAPAGPTGTMPPVRPPLHLPELALAPEQQRRIIELTVGGDQGAAYAAINADGPFKGRHGPGHKAFQRYHTGLSFGIAEFNQDAGTLGQLLRLMQERDPADFVAIFGVDAAQLLEVTTAPGPSGEHVEGGRGPRVQPVAGTDLWEEPWLSKFRAAGSVPTFQAAQNQLTGELHLAPMLTVAAGFGLATERALCLVLDRSIRLGEQGAKRWLADTVGPISTHALRQAALAALGFVSVEEFQTAVPGLLVDGEFGPVTHAALTAALRALGAESPVPVPTTAQMVDEIVRRAMTEEGSTRLLRLAATPELGDVALGG